MKEKGTVYEFKNEADRATLKIYDYIGKYEEVNAKDISDKLDQLSGMPLDIYINSGGGEVFEGVTIYNALKRYHGQKTVYIDGIAASIASVIAMAADKVVMNKMSMLMIHNAVSFCYGNAADFEDMAEKLKKINDLIRIAYIGKTKMSEEKIKEYMDNETYFKADEAKELGFCDEISDEDQDEEKTQQATNLVMEMIGDRIKQLKALKEEVFQAETKKEEEERKETSFFNNQALTHWLKG